MKIFRSGRRFFAALVAAGALLGGGASALLGICGPFTDVSDPAFCPFVLEIFYLGLTTGTTPTTYDPASSVSRLQMAAFLSRSVDGVVRRVSRRAALQQFWTPQNGLTLGLTTLPGTGAIKSDGADLWVVDGGGFNTVSRVRGSDGKQLETWTGAGQASQVLVAMGRVFVTGYFPGASMLYRLDPGLPAGAVTTIATDLGSQSQGLTFDGTRIWTANLGLPASVSIVTPAASLPWPVTTVTTGFGAPVSTLYDGANVWVTDIMTGTLLKLNGSGAILQTVTLGGNPLSLAFDGANLWVATYLTNSVWVVRASTGAVLATLTGNGLSGPGGVSFDGQRVLVTDETAPGVSLWKAADLTPLGFSSTGAGTGPTSSCRDGINFWVVLSGTSQLARF